MTLKEAVNKYVEYSVWIRELSAPQLSEIEGAEEYRQSLLRNFMRIGDIAKLNGEVLDDYLTPVIESERMLSAEEVEALLLLKDKLLDAYQMDNLDIPLLYLIVQRLCEDAERKDFVRGRILALDDFVMASYTLYTMTRRLIPFCDSADNCREEGLKASDEILEYLAPGRFVTLQEPETREAVLINARYVIALYEQLLAPAGDDMCAKLLEMMERALSLKDDPFYRREAQEYDWIYHEFRTLQYLANLPGFFNAPGYNDEQIKKINAYTKRLDSFWTEHNEEGAFPDTASSIRLDVLRNACLAGELDVDTFRRELVAINKSHMSEKPGYDEMIMVTSVPLEYIRTVDPENLTDEQKKDITGFYRNLIRYAHRMPKHGHLTFLLSELILLLNTFIEIEDGIDFETMCLELMAAVHPPTYVHSLSVADLTACLAKHLYRRSPEMFEGIPGYPDEEAIEELAWHAAACHDIGKLFIVETIITYGRRLYDREFDWIKAHPDVGAALLKKHERTKPYVNVARGHHRWYDGRGGYPADYHPEEAADRLLVDLVLCADCIDASTDSVGRSYKQGKTLDQFLEELRAGSGTQYAPFLLELMEDETVHAELEAILNAGRNEKYRKTYRILESVVK